jgi:mxaD protein
VWAKVADFGDLGAWHPAVAKTEIVEGTDNKVGAKRVLTLQDGGKINETLTAYSVNKKSLSYEITESVLPVSDYKSTLSVKSAGKNKSVVTWVASFKHKDGSDDKTATGAINGVFDGGLGNLKKILEAK